MQNASLGSWRFPRTVTDEGLNFTFFVHAETKLIIVGLGLLCRLLLLEAGLGRRQLSSSQCGASVMAAFPNPRSRTGPLPLPCLSMTLRPQPEACSTHFRVCDPEGTRPARLHPAVALRAPGDPVRTQSQGRALLWCTCLHRARISWGHMLGVSAEKGPPAEGVWLPGSKQSKRT